MQHATVNEVLQMAIHMEEEGQKFYEKYAAHAQGEVKSTLLKLASDEMQHVEFFQKLYNGLENKSVDDYFVEEEVIAFFKSYVNSTAFQREVNEISGVKEAIKEGIITERKTIDFYEQLTRFAEPDTASILKKIIEEETNHAKILEDLLETL